MQDEDPKFRQLIVQAVPHRIDSDGGLYTVHISAAKKAYAVQYLMRQLQVPPGEVICAGNDMNDFSMAELTRQGSWFIAVANASSAFKKNIDKLYLDLIHDGGRKYQLLLDMVLGSGNESVRIGTNLIRTRIQDLKAEHFEGVIERILQGNPQGETEASVLRQFQSEGAQREIKAEADRIFNINMLEDDLTPEPAGRYIAHHMAVREKLIALLEAADYRPRFSLPQSLVP